MQRLTFFKVDTDRDYFHLAWTCKAIHRLLVERPYKNIHIYFHPDWKNNVSGSVTKYRKLREVTAHLTSVWQMDQSYQRERPNSLCGACAFEASLLCIKADLDRRAKKISKDLQELTLAGWLPHPLSPMFANEDEVDHSLKGARGLCVFQPRILNIELGWAGWSPMMLCVFDLTRLRSLKIPVRASSACMKTAAALSHIPRLASLAITGLSDSREFVDEFRHLGVGILALSSSLRSLDISITKSDLAETWGGYDAFVEPDNVAFFFEKFFPEPSCEQIEALVRTRYSDPQEAVYVNMLRSSKGPLNLECIRLKHIGLPWWAFQTVFNPESIRELDLLACRVAPVVWGDLAEHAQLYKLANLSYAMLSGPLTHFLSTQHSLHFLSLVRPRDVYSQVDVNTFAVTVAAPHLGPGTEWGRLDSRHAWLLQSSKAWTQHEYLIQSPRSWSYFENLIRSLSPYDQCQFLRKSDFVKFLSNNRSLKHLMLPVDMFDITPVFMACLAVEFPALESIEWGFDYACPVGSYLMRFPCNPV